MCVFEVNVCYWAGAGIWQPELGPRGDQGSPVQHSPVASDWCWFEQSPPPAIRGKVFVCQKAFFKATWIRTGLSSECWKARAGCSRAACF